MPKATLEYDLKKERLEYECAARSLEMFRLLEKLLRDAEARRHSGNDSNKSAGENAMNVMEGEKLSQKGLFLKIFLPPSFSFSEQLILKVDCAG